LNPAAPDTTQLVAQLDRIYQEINRLNLVLNSGELTQAKDLGYRVRQISRKIRELPSARLEEIAASLDSLGRELLTANIREREAAWEQLNIGQNRKKQLALKNIDRVTEKLKQLYRNTGEQNKIEFNQGGLNLGAKGIANAKKGIMGKLRSSPYNNARFNADKVGKRIKSTPKKEMPSNAYSMEHDLAERDVFKRIIDRLSKKRQRISQFKSSGQAKPVAATTSIAASTADRSPETSPQPQNIDYEGRRQSIAKLGLNPRPAKQKEKTAFLKKPKSYHKTEKEKDTPREFLIRAKYVNDVDLSELPQEKLTFKVENQSNLKLNTNQTLDKALQDQPVPLIYREIIRELYLQEDSAS
jgi:hypothetical protein